MLLSNLLSAGLLGLACGVQASAAAQYTSTPSCDAQENACRTAPDANQAYCSSQRCECDGVPDYCHPDATTVTVTSTVNAYATPSSTLSCADQEDACRTAPDANQAFCSAQRCGCDNGAPYCPGYSNSTSVVTSPPTPYPSPASCDAQENACRTAPDANQAYCSSQRCACDNGKPYCPGYSNSTSIATYPAHSTIATSPAPYPTSSSCEAQEDACRTAPDANQAYCSSQRCSCDQGKPYCAGYSSAIKSTGPAPTVASYTKSGSHPATYTGGASSLLTGMDVAVAAAGLAVFLL